MPRIVFEGFKTTEEAQAFGMRVLSQVKGWAFKPGQLTYDGDLMCEVSKVAESTPMTLMENDSK